MHFKRRRGGFLNKIPIIGPILSSMFGKGGSGMRNKIGRISDKGFDRGVRHLNRPLSEKEEGGRMGFGRCGGNANGGGPYGGGPYGGGPYGGGPYGGGPYGGKRRGGGPYGGKRRGGGWGAIGSMVLGSLIPMVMGHAMEGKGVTPKKCKFVCNKKKKCHFTCKKTTK